MFSHPKACNYTQKNVIFKEANQSRYQVIHLFMDYKYINNLIIIFIIIFLYVHFDNLKEVVITKPIRPLYPLSHTSCEFCPTSLRQIDSKQRVDTKASWLVKIPLIPTAIQVHVKNSEAILWPCAIDLNAFSPLPRRSVHCH